MALLDPWADTAKIAQQLQRPEAELVVVLGAALWCGKCQRLKPLFEALHPTQSSSESVWLWLDLEDHAELLGGYLPDDLPLWLRWRNGRCVQAGLLKDIDVTRQPPLSLQTVPVPGDLPKLWAGLATGDWE
jgi:Thioredoxin